MAQTSARGAAGVMAASCSAVQGSAARLQRALGEVAQLYKGVVGAATGASLIIGCYFAIYSSAKQAMRRHTSMQPGAIAFVSGAAAATGSSVVKVPLAVCIRSVQAGVYPNVMQASSSIVRAAGVRGLFTGFLPTLLEDVPDMAVKFAVFETLKPLYARLTGGRPVRGCSSSLFRIACLAMLHRLDRMRLASVGEDLCIGGLAGAAAAAATTPLDVVKTVMMCSASSRPTIISAGRKVFAEGGAKSFLTGVGPRALSNGLNSGIFFCFFELLKQVGSCHLMALVQPSAACISWRQYLSASSCKQSLPACDEDLAC
eukprot:jgi/Astpho2/2457/Aster-08377